MMRKNAVGNISKAAALRLAIELNETRFDTSPVKLAESLQVIMREFSIEDISSTMPYSKENIEETISMLNMDWDQFEQHEGADKKKEFVSISEFFSKLQISGIPKDLADKLEPALQQIIDREELTKKNSFMVFDVILAALAEEAEAVGETVQTAHKKK